MYNFNTDAVFLQEESERNDPESWMYTQHQTDIDEELDEEVTRLEERELAVTEDVIVNLDDYVAHYVEQLVVSDIPALKVFLNNVRTFSEEDIVQILIGEGYGITKLSRNLPHNCHIDNARQSVFDEELIDLEFEQGNLQTALDNKKAELYKKLGCI
jgi:hypothetical protein